MSILIKGMEMPKKGSWVTLRVFPNGQCFLYSWCGNDFDFMEHLTAVPVPPHGRLIEKNSVFELIQSVPSVDKLLPVEFMKALYKIQTVIEAEEEICTKN